ncbi:MAG: ATP-binding protein [Candidatus Tectomicrobia bacterium]
MLEASAGHRGRVSDAGRKRQVMLSLSCWQDQHCLVTPCRTIVRAEEDEGSGMPMEQLARIFAPYFTNKPQGNGLGLAISASIGAISCTSRR